MKFIYITTKAFMLFTLISLIASCSKLDKEITEIIDDPINPKTELIDCSSTLKVTINGNLDIINQQGKAIIFPIGNCQGNYPFVIMVTKEDFHFWGDSPNILALSNGMPGFAFVAENNTKSGDELTHMRHLTGAGTLFSNGLNEHNYGFNENVEFIVTNFGTEIGDTIKAVIEGNFIDYNDDDKIIPFKAEFCVPVTYVCQ